MKQSLNRRTPREVFGCLLTVFALLGLAGCGADSPARARAAQPAAGVRLWVDPHSPAAVQAAVWRRSGDTKDAALIEQIAREPTPQWLTGGTQPGARMVRTITATAARSHAVAEFVLYDIPDRDCGGYSSGGAATGTAYLQWVQTVVDALGQQRAIVILEPDAVAQAASGCLGTAAAQARYQLLAAAGHLLASDHRAHTYLDAGSAGWVTTQKVAQPLRDSGIADDTGFALNVANFYTTAQSISYGRTLSGLVGGKHFVIDTSRNGNGAPQSGSGVSHWCNPSGRGLGQPPTTRTGHALVDALLWIKYPGQSDGTCDAGDPPAGTWWPAFALGLVRGDSP